MIKLKLFEGERNDDFERVTEITVREKSELQKSEKWQLQKWEKWWSCKRKGEMITTGKSEGQKTISKKKKCQFQNEREMKIIYIYIKKGEKWWL